MVQRLRDLGHDVVTIQQVGRGSAPDADVLADATADMRAVLTHNHRHFKRLHGSRPHEGIISCTRDDDDFLGLAARIDEAIQAVPSLTNQFLRVVRPNPSAPGS